MKREYVIRKDRLEGKRIVELASKKLDTDRYNPKLLAERGYGYSLMEEYDKAMEDLNLSIQEDSTDENSYILRGDCLIRMEIYDEAIEDFNDALKIDVNDKRAYFHIGYCYEMIEEYDLALENYREAIAITELDILVASQYYKREDPLFYIKVKKKRSELGEDVKILNDACDMLTGIKEIVFN